MNDSIPDFQRTMKQSRFLLESLLMAFAGLAAIFHAAAEDPASVIVVAGAAGDKQFGDVFTKAAVSWQNASKTAGAHLTSIGLEPAKEDDLHQLQHAIESEKPDSLAELWIVLLGHGTYDGHEAKFNLRGDDVSATQLNEWLRPFQRPVIVINAFSSSGAFLKPLSGPNRIILSATKSGSEQNYSRFAAYLSESITDPMADLDKDGQISLLESFLSASQKVAAFYEGEGRIATEHALIDDNGDGLGTPSTWFQGVRAVKKARDGGAADGRRAHQIHLIRSAADRALTADQRAQRDALEMELAKLRETKGSLLEEDYLQQLEAILLQLAQIYHPKENADQLSK